MSAKLIQVIECEEHEGEGVTLDPHRIVLRYYSPDGVLLAERDAWKDRLAANINSEWYGRSSLEDAI